MTSFCSTQKHIFPSPDWILSFTQHGESEFNVIGKIGGDAQLSARGKLYAKALAKHVHALNLPSLQVWTSTLKRTKATSANIQAPQQHLKELDEIFSVRRLKHRLRNSFVIFIFPPQGECEGLTYEELATHFPRDFALRDHEKLKYRYPQGESYMDVIQRIIPVLMQLECETNVLTVSHQAILRCILGYFLDTPLEEIPYVHVPLHTIIKLTLHGHSYTMETVKMPIECVDTTRKKPANCAVGRNVEDALLTLPAHFNSLASITPCI